MIPDPLELLKRNYHVTLRSRSGWTLELVPRAAGAWYSLIYVGSLDDVLRRALAGDAPDHRSR